MRVRRAVWYRSLDKLVSAGNAVQQESRAREGRQHRQPSGLHRKRPRNRQGKLAFESCKRSVNGARALEEPELSVGAVAPLFKHIRR